MLPTLPDDANPLEGQRCEAVTLSGDWWERERTELAAKEHNERKELAAIYVKRGLDSTLANQVAEQLMAKDGTRSTCPR